MREQRQSSGCCTRPKRSGLAGSRCSSPRKGGVGTVSRVVGGGSYCVEVSVDPRGRLDQTMHGEVRWTWEEDFTCVRPSPSRARLWARLW